MRMEHDPDNTDFLSHPRVLTASSPDDGLYQMLMALHGDGLMADSRNGRVLRSTAPVITEWKTPNQRVSFLAARDANPFFHYLEAMWMLAGRQDVSYPSFFASQLKEYSDDGVTLAGAYGYRWRNHFNHDQVTSVIEQLRKEPTSRRVVIGMWDPDKDPAAGARNGKDLPCNDLIFFDVICWPFSKQLNMTVSCRSNDAVWGASGANAVHFSVLHEYVATMTGMDLGSYYQVSNNFHAYVDFPVVQNVIAHFNDESFNPHTVDPYRSVEGFTASPLFADAFNVSKRDSYLDFENVLSDPARFQSLFTSDKNQGAPDYDTKFRTRVLDMVNGEGFDLSPRYAQAVYAMEAAFLMHRVLGDTKQAIHIVESHLPFDDWRIACKAWLERRVK